MFKMLIELALKFQQTNVLLNQQYLIFLHDVNNAYLKKIAALKKVA